MQMCNDLVMKLGHAAGHLLLLMGFSPVITHVRSSRLPLPRRRNGCLSGRTGAIDKGAGVFGLNDGTHDSGELGLFKALPSQHNRFVK